MLDRRLGLIGVLLVFACSAALALWSGDSLRYVDEIDYHELAKTLVHKHEFAASSAPAPPTGLAATVQ